MLQKATLESQANDEGPSADVPQSTREAGVADGRLPTGDGSSVRHRDRCL